MVLTTVFWLVSTLALPVEIGTSSPTIRVATWLSVTTSDGLESTFTSVIERSALMMTFGWLCEPTRKLNPGKVWLRKDVAAAAPPGALAPAGGRARGAVGVVRASLLVVRKKWT